MANPIPSKRFSRSRSTRIAAGRVAAVALTGMLFLAYRLLEAETAPGGLVESPPLLGFDTGNPAGQTFTYKGYTNFPGSQGRVEISVLKDGYGVADRRDESLWTLARTVQPSNTSATFFGEPRYPWSTELGAKLFVNDIGENRWPQGGVARVRFKAVRGRATAFLPVRDTDGVQGLLPLLILADSTPNPTDACITADFEPRPPNPDRTCPSGTLSLPTPNYLGRKAISFPTRSGRTRDEETERYYQRAFIDPAGTVSVRAGIPNLEAFRRRYFGPIEPPPTGRIPSRRPVCVGLSTPETVATYFNRGDLGLGREMHCIDNQCTQELACYVKNYGGLDTSKVPPEPLTKFDDRAAALQALNAGKHFATVAMVERGWMSVGGDRPPNTVIFLVFDEEDKLSTGPVKLDNKGFNTFNPGNCLVCHGINSVYHLTDGLPVQLQRLPESTVSGAFFLPFDLQAFDYFSGDPAHPLSRAYQESAFRTLNRLVYLSDLFFNPSARELISTWYDDFRRETFLDNAVPRAWNPLPSGAIDREGDNNRQLYRNVIAKACRTCHISAASPGLDFGTPYMFRVRWRLQSLNDVCFTKEMPQAEQTMKVLWEASARTHFLNRMNLNFPCPFEVRP